MKYFSFRSVSYFEIYPVMIWVVFFISAFKHYILKVTEIMQFSFAQTHLIYTFTLKYVYRNCFYTKHSVVYVLFEVYIQALQRSDLI